MPQAAPRPKTTYRGTNLNPEHVEAWDSLAKHANMNANKFLRYVLTHLTKKDVDDLLRRGT